MNTKTLPAIWTAFGWNVIEVDGHSHCEIKQGLEEAKTVQTKPTAILAHTIKGKGVSFMENNNEWHHNRITKNVYERILEEWQQNA